MIDLLNVCEFTRRYTIPASAARLSSSLFNNKPMRALCVLSDLISSNLSTLTCPPTLLFFPPILMQSVKLSNSSNLKSNNSPDALELQLSLGSFIENIFLSRDAASLLPAATLHAALWHVATLTALSGASPSWIGKHQNPSEASFKNPECC